MTLPLFKIHPSQCGKIMGDVNKPTAKQLAMIDTLQAKEKRTPTQDATLAELIAKRDSKPELSAGAKTFCQNWVKEQIYERRQTFSSKYTVKGNYGENEAIALTAKIKGYGDVKKNEQYFSTEYMEGICDLLLPQIIEDTKCSWSCFTFPLFETELPEPHYFLQMQCYMKGYNRNKAAVSYCLVDAPEELIINEAWKQAKAAGLDEVEMDFYEEVKATMVYSHLPDELRFKSFPIDRDDTVIAAIEQQVRLCREYIATIAPTYTGLLFTPTDGAIIVEEL
jgi:hypothetical protein